MLDRLSFLKVKFSFFCSTLSSLPMSETVTSPLGSFLTISESTLAFIKAFPSTSISAVDLALITMSKI